MTLVLVDHSYVRKREANATNRTIFKKGGFRFFFYSRDLSERSHVHAENADGEVKIWLDTFEVVIVHRGIRREDINAAVRIAREQQQDLRRVWNEEVAKETRFGPANEPGR